ncbi:hypothetical protein [Legionella qingyii]|nr:hypothetical protein [Legionella qingyii]
MHLVDNNLLFDGKYQVLNAFWVREAIFVKNGAGTPKAFRTSTQ